MNIFIYRYQIQTYIHSYIHTYKHKQSVEVTPKPYLVLVYRNWWSLHKKTIMACWSPLLSSISLGMIERVWGSSIGRLEDQGALMPRRHFQSLIPVILQTTLSTKAANFQSNGCFARSTAGTCLGGGSTQGTFSFTSPYLGRSSSFSFGLYIWGMWVHYHPFPSDVVGDRNEDLWRLAGDLRPSTDLEVYPPCSTYINRFLV